MSAKGESFKVFIFYSLKSSGENCEPMKCLMRCCYRGVGKKKQNKCMQYIRASKGVCVAAPWADQVAILSFTESRCRQWGWGRGGLRTVRSNVGKLALHSLHAYPTQYFCSLSTENPELVNIFHQFGSWNQGQKHSLKLSWTAEYEPKQ